MDKLSIPAEAAPHIDALRDLIRTGAMASPTLISSCLIDLPVVYQRSGADASPIKRAHVFIKLLQQVTQQRLEGNDAKTAGILFGFGTYAGMPIQDRYRAVAKLYNPHWTWENYRKEPLTRHLLAVYLALEREAELIPTMPHFGNQPPPPLSGMAGQDWVLERIESTYNFPSKSGQPLGVVEARTLRASSREIDVYRHRIFWPKDAHPGTPEITLFGPGTISIADTHIDAASGMRIFIIEVRFPRPFLYGQSVELTLVKRMPVQYDQIICNVGQDWYGVTMLASPAEYVKIGLRFPSKQPRSVWRHQDIISGLIRPGAPTKENRLTLDETGFVSHTWSGASAGLSYGISLEW